MCLNNVIKTFNKNEDFGYGYKVFIKRDKGVSSPIKDMYIIYPFNKWIKVMRNPKIMSDIGSFYRGGFHIFLSEADANTYITGCLGNRNSFIVKRVRYRKVSAIGKNKIDYNREGDCVIAKEMYIEEKDI